MEQGQLGSLSVSVESRPHGWPQRLVQSPAQFVAGSGVPLVLAWGAAAVVVFFILIVVGLTFIEGFPVDSRFSIRNYAVLVDPFTVNRVLPNTLAVGAGSVAVVLLFAVPLAWLLNRTDIPGREAWVSLIAVSVMVPSYLKAMGWLLLLNPKIGLINHLLAGLLGVSEVPLSVSNVWGIAFIQGLMLTPTMFFLLSGPMRALDPALEEAAAVAGSSRWETTVRITLPLLWPGILGGVIYTAMTAIAIFDVASVLGGFNQNPVLATVLVLSIQSMGESIVPNFGVAGVYGMLIALPSLAGLYFYYKVLSRERSYAVVTGKGYRAATVRLGGWKWAGVGFVWLYALLAVFFPFLLLFWQSLVPTLRFPSAEAFALMTLRNYREALNLVGESAITNSILITVAAPLLTLIFGFMISWVVVRTHLAARRTLDIIAMLPHAVPGIAFAFSAAMLAIFLRSWTGIVVGGTLGVIVLVHVINRLSYTTRVTNAALLQISHELEEAAQVSGATRLVAMQRVLVPLIAPSLLYASVWSALLVFQDVTIALMLSGPRSQLLSAQIWWGWRVGQQNTAAAAGVVLVLVMTVMIVIAQKLGVRSLDRSQAVL